MRTYPEPTAQALLAAIQTRIHRARNLRAQTTSDARIGDDRAKVKVVILAEWGGRLRFQAINPNEATAADLASDGAEYCFIDYNHSCFDCGPATPENVGRLIRIVMPPDDVVATLLGGTPVLAGAKGAVRWDRDEGHEVVELEQGGFRQTIRLAGQDRRWDVLSSELTAPDGTRVWQLRHKDFSDVKVPGGEPIRLPRRSLFEQHHDSVLIDWREQEVNVELPEAAFRLEVPTGLPRCK